MTSLRRHTEQHVSAPVIEHGAHSGRCLTTRSRRTLELQRLGLAFGGQRQDPLKHHMRICNAGRTPVSSSTFGPMNGV